MHGATIRFLSMLGNSYCGLFATKIAQPTFEKGWKVANKTVVDG